MSARTLATLEGSNECLLHCSMLNLYIYTQCIGTLPLRSVACDWFAFCRLHGGRKVRCCLHRCSAKFTMASMWISVATTLTALVAGTHAVSPVLFWASFPVLPNETVVIAGSGFATANGVCTLSPKFMILPTE
jgi:hypothetical protein